MAGGGDRDEALATGMDMVELQRQQHEQRQRVKQLELRLQLREQMTLQLQKEEQRKTRNLQYMIDQQQLAASSALASSRAADGCNALMVGGKAQADLLDGRGRSSGGASIGGVGGGVKSREGSTAVAPAETKPPGAADTAAKARIGGSDAGGHGSRRYGMATGRGPPVLQPLPLELSQVMERLALAHGDSWSCWVLREVVRPRAAAVLAEVTVGATTRQQWGAAEAAAVAAEEGGDDIGIVLLPAATAQALANATLLFLPSAGLPAVEALHQPAAAPHSTAVMQKEAAEGTAASPAAVVAATAANGGPQTASYADQRGSFHFDDAAPPGSAVQIIAAAAAAAVFKAVAAERAAAVVAMQDEEQASPTCVAPSNVTIRYLGRRKAQLNLSSSGLIPHDPSEGTAWHGMAWDLAPASSLPTAVAKTSSGGQLAGSIGLGSSAAEAQAQGPMPASADPLLDTPTTAARLPLQPPLPSLSFRSLSSGGSSGLVPVPCLSPSTPSVQDNPQPELPSDLSLLPTGPLASPTHAPNSNTGSKLSPCSSLTTAQSPASGPFRRRRPKVNHPSFVALGMLSSIRGIFWSLDGPDNVRDVEHALDKYCPDAPQSGNAQVEFEVMAWTDVICKILRGERIDALLLDERLKVKTGFYMCQLVRQYEVDHNLPQKPIIGISATVKRADLERYASSGYSAIWGNSINEHTAGKICNYLTTYKPPSRKRRAEMKRGDIADFTRPFNGFMAFIYGSASKHLPQQLPQKKELAH
eukprot:SM000199S05414  [mRNA]  locus=s199:246553:250338:+ [translate_table: standard]